MFLEIIRSEGLSHVSYLIGDGGQAAVIDPRRHCDELVAMAHRKQARITHIFETHVNEDLVSGALHLARRTGAVIHRGPGLCVGYGAPVREGDSFVLGNMILRVLETPGHTADSISLVVIDASAGQCPEQYADGTPVAVFQCPEQYADGAPVAVFQCPEQYADGTPVAVFQCPEFYAGGAPVAVFTGDTLLIGATGRVDLLGGEARVPEAAGMLYDSLVSKLLPLGDQTIVLPAHGAGTFSALGVSARRFSTVGHERLHNPDLQVDCRQTFIERKQAEILEMPPYFRVMHDYNLNGPPPMPAIALAPPLSVDEFAKRQERGMQVVDVRSAEAYVGAHIPGSLALPLDLMSRYAGWFLDYQRDIGIVADSRQDVDAAVRYLGNIGYDRIVGSLAGGMTAWESHGRVYPSLPTIDIHAIERRVRAGEQFVLLDVRTRAEVNQVSIPRAMHVFVGDIPRRHKDIPRDEEIVVFCKLGKRATMAASLLERYGFEHVTVWLGSITAAEAVDSELLADPGDAECAGCSDRK